MVGLALASSVGFASPSIAATTALVTKSGTGKADELGPQGIAPLDAERSGAGRAPGDFRFLESLF